MGTAIRAIETRYKGYRMRSRLEARWGVYFDTLGVEWEYEPEGFDLGDAGLYLPDFYLRTVDMWAEVKAASLNDDELKKANTLARVSKKHVLHLIGTPDMKPYYVSYYCPDPTHPGAGGVTIEYGEHIEYHTCLLTAEYIHSEHRFFWEPGGGEEPCQVARKAVNAARAARFEHGESGAAR